jgi:ClpP class serine protease
MYAMEENFLSSYLETRLGVMANIGDEQMRQEYNSETRRIENASILSIDGDTAHIDISGPLSRKGPDWIDALFGFGGTSTIEIIEAIQKADADPTVARIVLDMDTPGGEAIGTDEVWQAVMKATKRVTVVNHGMIASGGYYIASGADEIVSTSPMNEVGSIGVVIATWDLSKAYEEAGYKRVVIVSENAPDKYPDISKESGVAILRKQVNAIERIFYDRIASGRNVSKESIKENFGRGGLMTSRDPDGNPDAISVGMIDGLVEDSIDTNFMAATNPADVPENQPSGNSNILPAVAGTPMPAPVTEKGNQKGKRMTFEEMKTNDPALHAEVDAKMKAEYERGKAEAKAEIEKRITLATPFVTSKDYPDVIKNAAADVIKGTRTEQSLTDMVAIYDTMKAGNDVATAATESGATPAPAQKVEAPVSKDPGIADSPEALEALYSKEVK